MNAAQIIIAQRFVNVVVRPNDNFATMLAQAVINTQNDIFKSGVEATVVVKQVITTGTLEIKATIILDVMQIVKIQPPEEPDRPFKRL